MKQKIRALIEGVFGVQENIAFKINMTILVSGTFFFLFAFIQEGVRGKDSVFTFLSSLFLVLWLVLVKGVDSFTNIAFEMLRILVFLFGFIFSLAYILEYILHDSEISVMGMVAAIIGMVCSIFYLVCKFFSVFSFVKNIFRLVKKKLFNTEKPASNKFKAAIENITTFLVSIGGFAIAIKTIVETVFQITDLVMK